MDRAAGLSAVDRAQFPGNPCKSPGNVKGRIRPDPPLLKMLPLPWSLGPPPADLVQPAQENPPPPHPPPEEAPKSALVGPLLQKTDILRWTLFFPHFGHFTGSLPEITNSSKVWLHSLQSYSYIGTFSSRILLI